MCRICSPSIEKFISVDYGFNKDSTSIMTIKNKPMKKYIWAKDTPYNKKGDPANQFGPRERERLLAEGWIEEAGRWKPELGQDYYTIYYSSFSAIKSVWDNDETDKERYKCGNAFETEEKALTAIEKVKDLLLSLHE